MKTSKMKTEKFAHWVAAVALTCVLIVMILLALSGCSMKWKQGKCRQWGVCQAVKDSTHIVIKDSTYLVPVPYEIDPDSAWLIAYFECDSLNRVTLRNSEQTNGKYLRLLKDIQDGKYTVTAYYPARTDTVYVPVTDHSEVSDHVRIEPEYINVLTKWQQFRLNAFWPLAIVVLLVVLYLIYRIYRKIKGLISFKGIVK